MLRILSRPVLPLSAIVFLLMTGCSVSTASPRAQNSPIASSPATPVPAPAQPAQPAQPSQPIQPTQPTQPVQPSQPSRSPVEVAMTENLTFTLVNSTSSILTEFYASPVNVDQWEDDILGADTVPVNGSVNITIADGRTVCNYDILGVFADDTTAQESNVDLCRLNNGTYRFVE